VDDEDLPGDEVVDDDEVQREESVAPDVYDLEPGEGEDGELVDLKMKTSN
jgi:hypothetical protein